MKMPEARNFSEYATLNELMRNLKSAGWHRILIKKDPGLFRLTNISNKLVEKGHAVHPALNSAMLAFKLKIDFNGSILGGSNTYHNDLNHAGEMANRLGLSLNLFLNLEAACQEMDNLNDYQTALRQDLESQFPLQGITLRK